MSVLLNLSLVVIACMLWRKNRSSCRNGSLFEIIVRTGMKAGHKVSDDSCIELLLTGKLDEEATSFFRWAASECFARYAHDGSISRLYEVWFTPSFDGYRIYSDKTPIPMFHPNLTNDDISRSDIHNLHGKTPGVVSKTSTVIKENPPSGNLQDGGHKGRSSLT